jgi:hypothetical protein
MSSRYLRGMVVLAAVVALVGGATHLRAQQNGNGPCCLVIAYKTAPELRPKLREYLGGRGLEQFHAWQKQGVFERFELYFSSFSNQNSADFTAVLHFAHFSDIAGWSRIEREAAGGLATAKDSSLIPVSTDLADEYRSGVGGTKVPDGDVCVLIPYTVNTSMEIYRSYVDGYVVPQLEGWIKRGAMVSYAILMNQNGAGSAWDSMLVLEYRGYAGLAQREVLKAKVREDLASNQAWQKWSLDKSHTRTEGKLTVVEPIESVGP